MSRECSKYYSKRKFRYVEKNQSITFKEFHFDIVPISITTKRKETTTTVNNNENILQHEPKKFDWQTRKLIDRNNEHKTVEKNKRIENVHIYNREQQMSFGRDKDTEIEKKREKESRRKMIEQQVDRKELNECCVYIHFFLRFFFGNDRESNI